MQPFASAVNGLFATSCAAILVFVFLGAMLVRFHQQVADEFGPTAAARLLVFADAETLTAVLIGLCIAAVLLLVIITLDLARRERRERLEAAKWATQTLQLPSVDWRPTRRYAAFLSPYQHRCKCSQSQGARVAPAVEASSCRSSFHS